MDTILRSHCISPHFLRNNNFEGFYADRKATLLRLVETAMGKQSIVTSEMAPEDQSDSDEDPENDNSISVQEHAAG
jgi:hypothetical protein